MFEPGVHLQFSAGTVRNRPRTAIWLSGLIIAGAILAAWSATFHAPFVFDDSLAIQENPTIRELGKIGSVLSPPHQTGTTVNGRPLVNLSLALNYALGGTSVRGYHAGNLLIHLLSALTLFAVVRRTLQQARLRNRFGADAVPLALAIAVLWAVHPLQTESVTYIVQRAEALAALFYLLTIYCFIRSLDSASARAWQIGAVAACLLGMATKEVMVSAPLLVWLYDRTFGAGTLLAAWRRRKKFYLTLAGTWLLLGYLVLASSNRGGTAGFGPNHPWWNYALTQIGAIVHYLALAVWPHPLVFDYGMGVVKGPGEIAPQALFLISLLAATVLALRDRPALGFMGVWFFAILAPTSSVVPIATQTVAEHRVYLPLAAVVAGGVLALYATLGRRLFWSLCLLALALVIVTFQRNQDYRTALALWADTVTKRPDNPRAQNNLGNALVEADRIPEALTCFTRALALLPEYPETHNNLGYALAKTGRLTEAVGHYEEALRLRPDYARAHANLGNGLTDLGNPTKALEHFAAALQLKPDFADAHWGMGNALAQLNRAPDAVAQYEEAVRLDPAFAEAHCSLGTLLGQSGRTGEAIAQDREALRLKPNFPEAHNNLGNHLLKIAPTAEAIPHYREALRLKPDYVEARVNLANALVDTGQRAEAVQEYETALRQKPDQAEAHTNLGNMLAESERMTEALVHFESAARIDPGNAGMQVNLANALLFFRRDDEARAHYERALQLDPADGQAREMLARLKTLGDHESAPKR